jgi:hypothetical protein
MDEVCMTNKSLLHDNWHIRVSHRDKEKFYHSCELAGINPPSSAVRKLITLNPFQLKSFVEGDFQFPSENRRDEVDTMLTPSDLNSCDHDDCKYFCDAEESDIEDIDSPYGYQAEAEEMS